MDNCIILDTCGVGMPYSILVRQYSRIQRLRENPRPKRGSAKAISRFCNSAKESLLSSSSKVSASNFEQNSEKNNDVFFNKLIFFDVSHCFLDLRTCLESYNVIKTTIPVCKQNQNHQTKYQKHQV